MPSCCIDDVTCRVENAGMSILRVSARSRSCLPSSILSIVASSSIDDTERTSSRTAKLCNMQDPGERLRRLALPPLAAHALTGSRFSLFFASYLLSRQCDDRCL